MGCFAFMMPFALSLELLIPCFVAVCTSATVSAVETAVITWKAKDPENTSTSLIRLFRVGEKRADASEMKCTDASEMKCNPLDKKEFS